MAKTPKMTTCRHCGKEIAASAKTCPHCGGKNKKPVYKRIWFIILVVLIVICCFASCLGSGDSSSGTASSNSSGRESGTESAEVEEEVIEYTPVTSHELLQALESNALKASDTYKNAYVEVSGTLGTIDSSGDYIVVDSQEDPYTIANVQVYLKNDDQKAVIMEMTTGDPITIRGQVTSVGEVLGYSINLIEIVQ